MLVSVELFSVVATEIVVVLMFVRLPLGIGFCKVLLAGVLRDVLQQNDIQCLLVLASSEIGSTRI